MIDTRLSRPGKKDPCWWRSDAEIAALRARVRLRSHHRRSDDIKRLCRHLKRTRSSGSGILQTDRPRGAVDERHTAPKCFVHTAGNGIFESVMLSASGTCPSSPNSLLPLLSSKQSKLRFKFRICINEIATREHGKNTFAKQLHFIDRTHRKLFCFLLKTAHL